MWLTLALAIIVCALIFYVPGYLLCRALSFGRFASVAAAPGLTTALYSVLGVAFVLAGITCEAWVLMLVGVVICAIIFCIAYVIKLLVGRKTLGMPAIDENQREKGSADGHFRRREAQENGRRTAQAKAILPDSPGIWKYAALYVGVAFVLTFVIFIMNIHTADAFARMSDTGHHLSLVRAYLETGTYSTLHSSLYLDHDVWVGFYPSAWHVIVAMVASLFGDAVTIATNAATIVSLFLIFPLSVCLLFDKLISRIPGAMLAGSLFVLAFCGFPWGFIEASGQLFPNMISWMFIPATLVMFMQLFEASSPRESILLAIGMIVSLLGVAIAQPNGVFTFCAMALLWWINSIFYPKGSERAVVTKGRVIGAIILVIIACVAWVVIYNMPAMQALINYSWEAKGSIPKAAGMGILFFFRDGQGVEPLLTILVIIGIIYSLRNRRYLWLTVGYLICLGLFVLAYATDSPVKQLLTGFWYTDSARMGAMAVLFAMPLVTIGFAWPIYALTKRLEAKSGEKSPSALAKFGPAALGVVILAVCQFIPVSVKIDDKTVWPGLVAISYGVDSTHSWERLLTSEEDAFVKKAMEIIPDDAMVMNMAMDGSGWSHGVEGIDIYFRRTRVDGMGDKETSKLLRHKLNEVETNEKVRQALRDVNAQYVLILDDLTSDNRTLVQTRYKPENWVGIESITEDTPGFTLVMSEGDMRLYQIDFMVEEAASK